MIYGGAAYDIVLQGGKCPFLGMYIVTHVDYGITGYFYYKADAIAHAMLDFPMSAESDVRIYCYNFRHREYRLTDKVQHRCAFSKKRAVKS